MTIIATHFALVLGAWRLRVRIDLDEPSDAELSERRFPPPATADGVPSPNRAGGELPRIAPWG